MNILPTERKIFKLIGSKAETLERLHRRTEVSDTLSSRRTERSFVGKIEGNEFRLISSAIWKGAFCVMTGAIDTQRGYVRVEIHRVFRILIGAILCFPMIAVLISATTGSPEFSPMLIVVALAQTLILRYAFVGIAFRLLAREGLNRLRDTLDVEWIAAE